ncbi:MAG: homoprotocatechuate degradation operon regulator HpaR [Gammaproteobacteria bacterium]|jgi:homoprotocatechuate degradation regulator HpaR
MELLRAREAAMARFRPMLREHGLTEQQWRVIRILAEYPKTDASELSRRALLLAPSLSRIFQFLEREKLITRSADPEDQRRSIFSLSAKGRALYERVAPESEALYTQIEAAFGSDNLKELYGLLALFHGSLSEDRS